MTTRTFSPGFRCSALDVVVLVVGTITCIAAAQFDLRSAFVIGFTVGHFFLFCNMFRMSRPLELIWSAVFVGLCVATFQTGWPGWIATAALSLLMTVIVVAIEMRGPSYHGVCWRTINPRLPEWWEAQITSRRTETTA
jgi:hypothetical protein